MEEKVEDLKRYGDKVPLTVDAQCHYSPASTGKQHLFISYEGATISLDGKEVGRVMSPVGGGVSLKFTGGESFHVGAEDLWNALCESLGRRHLLV